MHSLHILIPMQETKPTPILFIRELCKHKTEEEILEAEENFREYLRFVKQVCDRVEAERKAGLDSQAVDGTL